MMRKFFTLLTALLVVPSLSSAASAWKNPTGSGSVHFLAVGRPSMLKIHGEAKGPDATLKMEGTQLKGTVEIDVEKFQTGIALRDQHMKEKYLQVKEFPKATLSLLEAPVESGFEKTLGFEGEKAFRGKLSLHGKDKEVTGSFAAKDGLIQAKFPITLSDFAIEIPKYLGVTVADKVEINAELPLKKD